MTSKIRILDEHTINKIAAGEVIESPASVVKELVENSLDAGATEICVEVKGGGRQLIRITDNGCGMNKDDVILCLERHATSKIKQVEDIQSIFTMGFRGEAIPSIAAISKLTILTATRDEDNGTLLIVEGGNINQCGKAVRSPGTTIEVKSLFFNVPVRRKFQRSPAHDAAEIFKVLTVLSLGYPNIKFQLIEDQKTKIQTGSPQDQIEFSALLKERISSVMGSELIAGCCPVDISTHYVNLVGYIGLPAYSRANRTGQYLFINRRAVFSPLISHLVREAYGTTLPQNKHPIFILHLSLPGEFIDVNVHPQKKEVRLRQESGLKEVLLKGIQQALQKGAEKCHSLFSPNPETAYEMPKVRPTFPIFPGGEKQELKKDYTLPIQERIIPQKPAINLSLFPQPPVEKRSFPKVLNTIPNYIILDALSLESWRAIPQDGLCLLDQKAAHARVIFENLLQAKPGEISVQALLIPQTLNLSPHEANLLRLHLNTFLAAGIHVHEIGNHSFMVEAIPSVFGNVDIVKLMMDLMENILDVQEKDIIEKEIERRVALSASYAAVNTGKRLQIEEAQGLVNHLFKCQTPFLCPKGKPTLSYIGADELIKKFQKSS